MSSTRILTWIVLVAILAGAAGLLIGRLSSSSHSPDAHPKDIRKGESHVSQKALDFLKSIPVVKAGSGVLALPQQMLEPRVGKVDPIVSIYSLIVGQSITVTPSTAFSDFVGTVAQGHIYEFVAEPTNGYPATGDIDLDCVPLNQTGTSEHYAGVSLIDVPTGQRYLVDFQAAAINDGSRGKNSRWLVQLNGVDAQYSPTVASTPNASIEQHVFVVVESSGQHFTYVTLSNESPEGPNLLWYYEGATVTRIL